MLKPALAATLLAAIAGGAMAQEIRIRSDWGEVTARLADHDSASAFAAMLPLRIEMRDHLRQEKTAPLPDALPQQARQRDFHPGLLGLWGGRDFVVYYREGRVPQPGIVVLGEIEGDVSIFDRPGPVTLLIERLD